MNQRALPFLVIALLSGAATLAQTSPAAARLWAGYTYEVKPSLANQRVFVCVQHPVDEVGNVPGKGDLTAQTQQVMKNIKDELAKRGLTLKDVRQVSYRIKGYSENSNAALATANNLFTEFRPGITDYKNVAGFSREDMLLEIEVVAVK